MYQIGRALAGRLTRALRSVEAEELGRHRRRENPPIPVRTTNGQARWILATADADFDTSNATVAVTVTDFWDGSDPDPEAAGLTIDNTGQIFYGAASSVIIACYDPESDVYKIVNVSCPAA